MLRRLRRILFGYLIVTGVLAHAVPIAALYWAIRHYQVSPGDVAAKLQEKLEVHAPRLAALLAPAPRYANHVLDGRLREAHPRILLPGLAGWAGPGRAPLLAERMRRYAEVGIREPTPKAYCRSDLPAALALCWLIEGSDDSARRAIRKLDRAEVIPGSPDHSVTIRGVGPAWQLALAYDLLFNYPEFDAAARQRPEAVLRAALSRNLERLDGDSLSLWHSRASIAAQTWLLALALGDRTHGDAALLVRAQGHFLAAIDALRLTEAWPGGYNYWINNRALPIALAASGYVNGLEHATRSEAVRDAVRRAAYWNIYAVRPDRRIEGLGDEGPRVDQRDETRRFIDVVVELTRDPVLSAYSRYLERLYGAESYYSDYRWSFPLFNDPTVAPAIDVRNGGLAGLAGILPMARVFGRGALNLAFIRSGWRPDSTIIGFRAGATMSHHGHYDAGHFTIFKGAPLAVNSSLYSGMRAENRLDYSMRTVAKNSILVLRPGERVRPNRFFKTNVAAGGQRLTLPTGSAITSLDDFRANLGAGLHLEGGTLRQFDYRAGTHAFISADITKAYDTPAYDSSGSGGKVESAVRDLLYLYDDDVLVIRDRVRTTSPDYVVKWLLHTIERPDAAGATVRVGGPENGILESSSPEVLVHNGRGRLVVRRFAPEDGIVRLIGGPSYSYYVETDGDDRDLDGANMSGGARRARWFDAAEWRIEFQGTARTREHRFLIGLAPSLDRPRTDAIRALPLDEGKLGAVATDSALVLFATEDDRGEVRFRVPGHQKRVYLVGARPGSQVSLATDRGDATSKTASGYLVVFDRELATGERLTLRLAR